MCLFFALPLSAAQIPLTSRASAKISPLRKASLTLPEAQLIVMTSVFQQLQAASWALALILLHCNYFSMSLFPQGRA